MSALFLVLRIIHIVSGVLWIGALITLTWFIFPTVMELGPTGGAFMRHIVGVKKMPDHVLRLALTTLAAGLVLMWLDVRGTTGWMGSRFGMGIGTGATFGIIIILMGMTINVPTAKKLTALSTEIQARGGAPTEAEQAQIKAYQNKLLGALRAASVLGVLAAAAMASARYL